MINLSLVMITKNEEGNIERCLRSVEGLANEIVIVDTGSTDRTIEIARSLNANVFQHTFEPFSFAKARNKALRYAMGDWILQLDADEELASSSREQLEAIIQEEKNQAYICNLQNSIEHEDQVKFQSVRLFRNHPDIRYVRDCHEDVYPSIYKLGFELIESDIIIYHYGYNVDYEKLKGKSLRNLLILLRMYRNKPHWLTAFHIGQSYLVLGKDTAAQIYLTRAHEDLNCPGHYREQISQFLAS